MARSRCGTSVAAKHGQPNQADITVGWDAGPDPADITAGPLCQPWHSRAACRNRITRPEDDLWFAPTAMRGRAEPDLVARARLWAAKQICASCPVRSECLAYALATGQRDGVWGGLSEAERTALRRARRAAASATGEASA